MLLAIIFGALTALSLGLTLWQFVVARRFPLHQRAIKPDFFPAVTLLKPLKGADSETAGCLESWLRQEYGGAVQILFGVATEDDPAAPVVRDLLARFPAADAELVICPEVLGANAKVSKLIQLHRRARHDVIVVSDADTFVTPDFLANLVQPLRDPATGLVNCFYELATPATAATRWEAVAVNADFWSQVLQSRSLKPVDFALGAVMTTRREELAGIGGFEALADYLADDYQLGQRIARRGKTIAFAGVTVACRERAMGWGEVWGHQLRWARTIRVCQPGPFFLSLSSNATLWPVAWLALAPSAWSLGGAAIALAARVLTALANEARLTRQRGHFVWWWLVPVKDLLQFVIWAAAFTGSRIEWRGVRYTVGREGKLERV
jgi:ceramide glucosyltransferase